jgi:hypothetical protein
MIENINEIDLDKIISESNILTRLKTCRNETYVQQAFNELFTKARLELLINERLLQGRPDSLFPDIIIDFKYSKNFNTQREQEWLLTKGKQYLDEFERKNNKKARLLIIITEKHIKYYDKDLQFIRELEITHHSIKSLLLALNDYMIVDHDLFANLFGIDSPIFTEILSYMTKHYTQNQNKIDISYKEWQYRFQIAYTQKEMDIDMFFKHSYLSLLIKIILFKSYLPDKSFSAESFIELINYFDTRNIAIFQNDFFHWVLEIKYVTDLLFDKLKRIEFKTEDIFKTIYQNFISYDARHTLGEYYTPNVLARLMLNHAYKFGQVVLDPSCGSGTFLIETLNIIMTSDADDADKISACNKIYGFDINPIAVLTTKANLLLFYKFHNINNFSLNIYLCDSLFPITFKKTTELDIGYFYEYYLTALDETIKISEKLLDEEGRSKFIKILKILDTSFNDTNNTDELIKIVLLRCNSLGLSSFLEQRIGSTHLILKDNVINIVQELHKLHLNNQDRIWVYILYNYVGVKELYNFVDLIIGNPPWVVLRNIKTPHYQDKVKELATRLEIKPPAHQIANIELATLFFYRCASLFCKENGTIFFVLTRGVLDGDQSEKFRYFSIFTDIELWDFTNMIFNIPNICLKARYSRHNQRIDFKNKIPIPRTVYTFKPESNEIVKVSEDEIVPYHYDTHNKIAKKFMPQSEVNALLPAKKSYYADKFFDGACLYPRPLVFVTEIEQLDNNLSLISSNTHILERAKDIWKTTKLIEKKVEKEYLFPSILSTSMFIPTEKYTVFLPLTRDLKFMPNQLKPYAKKLYEDINDLYVLNKRNTTKFKTILDCINYQGKLCTNRQKQPYKVAYNGIGSIIKAAVIASQDILIDYSLFYYSTTNKQEAYYLCAYLNSNLLNSNISRIKNSRNICKRPFDFPLPRFDPSNPDHQQLANLAMICETKLTNTNTSHKYSLTKMKEIIKAELEQIDTILSKIIKNDLNLPKSTK